MFIALGPSFGGGLSEIRLYIVNYGIIIIQSGELLSV